ncbi:hypothetical protein ABBQ32_012858 [Trebouxia sp. C0010 RCD-2024]
MLQFKTRPPKICRPDGPTTCLLICDRSVRHHPQGIRIHAEDTHAALRRHVAQRKRQRSAAPSQLTAVKATVSEQVPGVYLKVIKWDNLKDGQLGLDNMKKKLLEVGGAELVPITITAAPPYVYPEHCHNYVSWDGLVGGPATYYITHLDGKDEVIIFYLRRGGWRAWRHP